MSTPFLSDSYLQILSPKHWKKIYMHVNLFCLVETIGRKLESVVSLDMPFVLCVVFVVEQSRAVIQCS